MRMPVRRGITSCALLLAGCGGGMAKTSSPPSAPGYRNRAPAQTEKQERLDKKEPQPGGEGGYAAPAFAQPPPPADQPRRTVDQGADAETPLADAEQSLDRAASQLNAAHEDCALACKALESMRRSAERICELNGPEDPDQRCRKARERVTEAQVRVQNGCGDCKH